MQYFLTVKKQVDKVDNILDSDGKQGGGRR